MQKGFFQELYILTTKAAQGRSVTQENVCHSLGLVGAERLDGKLGRKGRVQFLWVASACAERRGRRGKVCKEGDGGV